MPESAEDPVTVERAVAVLEPFVSDAKKARMEAVLARRTAHIRLVLEDIYQTHNASAAMRSCECFGVQHLHVIEQLYPYSLNPDVDMGSRKWITLHRHRKPGTDNRRACLRELRAAGQRIVATTPAPDATPLHAFPLDRPFALCFGTEKDGLSDTLLGEADERLRIPMEGFTESFNISVSVALCLYDLTTRLRNSGTTWQLPPAEQRRVYLGWLRRAVRHADAILRRQGL
ncbi:MAG: RNA methyltransferase [Opitutales bacterium]|nr:RNA methyltransferase [Opitutales bacterium]